DDVLVGLSDDRENGRGDIDFERHAGGILAHDVESLRLVGRVVGRGLGRASDGKDAGDSEGRKEPPDPRAAPCAVRGEQASQHSRTQKRSAWSTSITGMSSTTR